MNREKFWKNFELGVELDISGRFIYNGLRSIHEIDNLYNPSEVFEFLYNISVGIERLSKIAVILIEHNKNSDQEAFEKSLITHNHMDLVGRVRESKNLPLSAPHLELLQLLSKFYKSQRYGRYGIDASNMAEQEKHALHRYIEKYLDITIFDEFPFNVSPLTRRIRDFLGRTIGKITTTLYKAITEEACRLGIYTYEIRTYTKAYKIFIKEEFNFFPEDILWKELIIAIANSKEPQGHLKHIRGIEPLSFDFGSGCDHLQAFFSEEKKMQVLDELEHLYDELESQKTRLEEIGVIGDPTIDFWDEEQEEDDNYFKDEMDDEDDAGSNTHKPPLA